jgi:hypothetical protein
MPLPLIDCNPESHRDKHLCALAERKQMLTVARLSKDGNYICALCGRVAAKEENLCSPVALSQIE